MLSENHIHMHLECPPSLAISDLVKRLKGRSSRKLQQKFPELRKRYWGKRYWGIGYGAWSTGNITDEMVNQFLSITKTASLLRSLALYAGCNPWSDLGDVVGASKHVLTYIHNDPVSVAYPYLNVQQ